MLQCCGQEQCNLQIISPRGGRINKQCNLARCHDNRIAPKTETRVSPWSALFTWYQLNHIGSMCTLVDSCDYVPKYYILICHGCIGKFVDYCGNRVHGKRKF